MCVFKAFLYRLSNNPQETDQLPNLNILDNNIGETVPKIVYYLFIILYILVCVLF